MHTVTIHTKFTFGDRVCFNSIIQGRTGNGEVYAITVYADEGIDYMIEDKDAMRIQPGILDNEMTRLSDPESHTPHTFTGHTKFKLGDRVRFDSPTQRCSGSGEIFAITFDADGNFDYMIRLRDESDLQPGIQEHEITLDA